MSPSYKDQGALAEEEREDRYLKYMIGPCPGAFLGERGLSKCTLLVGKGTVFEPTTARCLRVCYICCLSSEGNQKGIT